MAGRELDGGFYHFGSPLCGCSKLVAAVEFGHTPSMVFRHPTLGGVEPDTTGWDAASPAAPVAPDYLAKPARRVRTAEAA